MANRRFSKLLATFATMAIGISTYRFFALRSRSGELHERERVSKSIPAFFEEASSTSSRHLQDELAECTSRISSMVRRSKDLSLGQRRLVTRLLWRAEVDDLAAHEELARLPNLNPERRKEVRRQIVASLLKLVEALRAAQMIGVASTDVNGKP